MGSPIKKILWMTWKDKKNPLAGGAEVVNEEIAKRLAKDGFELILLTGGFPKGAKEEKIDGYKIIRVGSRWSVYWQAFRYYRQNLTGWADLVIDEMNTIPFLAKFYVKGKKILLAYQLCREIWFYQMFFPLNLIGYLIEPLYLRLLSDQKVITISESSKNDLIKYGFQAKNISIISVGIEEEPQKNLQSLIKDKEPTILSLGAIRPMKRTADQITAFEELKSNIPEAKMIIAGGGDGPYFEKVMEQIKKSKFAKDINYLGRVSNKVRLELMQKAHLIAVTSVKEGWGLIVTEANSQGTPAVVYNVDGLRDSVKDGLTGLVTKQNSPEELGKSMASILSDKNKYQILRENAWEWSKKINFEQCYQDFLGVINE